MDYIPLRLKYKSNILEFSELSIIVFRVSVLYLLKFIKNMALKIQGIVQGLNSNSVSRSLFFYCTGYWYSIRNVFCIFQMST